MADFELQSTLRGQFLVLRLPTADDFEALFAVASDRLIWEQRPTDALSAWRLREVLCQRRNPRRNLCNAESRGRTPSFPGGQTTSRVIPWQRGGPGRTRSYVTAVQ
jgi:hypothetical protein